MEEGLDAFVIIDGLPKVPQASKEKLVKFLLKKLNTVGKTKEDAIFMPLGQNDIMEGYFLGRKYLRISAYVHPDTPSSNTPHPSKLLKRLKSYTAPL